MIVFLGLSITSSWGNGHATTYRSLLRALQSAGQEVVFLERNKPWYAENRDLPDPPYARTILYESVDELRRMHGDLIRDADGVVVGSYVPDGVEVGEWVLDTARGIRAFYDIDTPVTLSRLRETSCEYLSPGQVRRYDLYLSFTGGPTLDAIEQEFGALRARPLYCSVDPELYFPTDAPPLWDLGYLGTYSVDRQPALEALLIQPSRSWADGRFVVAGPQYPPIDWPANVKRVEHLSPDEHRAFYGSMRYTLNITRADMVRAGYSPSVRLFEAACCGTPILSDHWNGIEEFFAPGEEILIARSTAEALEAIRVLPEARRREIGERAREKVLRFHTSHHRARELVQHFRESKRSQEWKRLEWTR